MSTEPLMSKVLFSKAIKNKVPLSGTFELSPCCNLKCKMCYVRKSRSEVQEVGGEIDIDSWLEIARNCKEAGMLFLLLTGGEPFLYKNFKELYEELIGMGFMVSINSNGTLIDKDTIKWLKKNPPHRINITLYGGSEETYEKLCGDGTAYSRTVEAIKGLKNAGMSVRINASMTPYNVNDLDKIYEFAKKIEVHVRGTAYMFPPVRREETLVGCGDRFTPEEAAHCHENIERARLSEEDYKKKIIKVEDEIRLKSSRDEECEYLDEEPLRCRGGRAAFWINWKGEMTPCGIMNKPSAQPFKDGFLKAWYEINEKTKKITMPKKCTSCSKRNLCSVCGAIVVSETGGFEEAPEYLCKMTDKIIEETNRTYKEILSI